MISSSFEDLPSDILTPHVSGGKRLIIQVKHSPIVEKILERTLKKIGRAFKKNAGENQMDFAIDFTSPDSQSLRKEMNSFFNRMKEEISQEVDEFSYQPQFNYYAYPTDDSSTHEKIKVAAELVDFSNKLYYEIANESLSIKNGYR